MKTLFLRAVVQIEEVDSADETFHGTGSQWTG
jgi:hypothetical protein